MPALARVLEVEETCKTLWPVVLLNQGRRANTTSLLPLCLLAKNSRHHNLTNPPTYLRVGYSFFFFSDKEAGGTEKLLNLQKVTQHMSGRIRIQTQAACLWRWSLTTAGGFAPVTDSTLLNLSIKIAMSMGGTKVKRERMAR